MHQNAYKKHELKFAHMWSLWSTHATVMCGAGSTSYMATKQISVSFISQSLMIMEIYAPQMPRFPIQEIAGLYAGIFGQTIIPFPWLGCPGPAPPKLPPKQNIAPQSKIGVLCIQRHGFKVLINHGFKKVLKLLTCWDSSFLYSKWFPVHIQYKWLEKKRLRLKIETDFTLIKLITRENGWYIPDPSGAMNPSHLK